jgi:uncharacterized iron-regulated protein
MTHIHQASTATPWDNQRRLILPRGAAQALHRLARQALRGTGAALVVLWVLWTGPAAAAPGEPWQARLGQDHPLVGRIWDVAAARFIDPTTLTQRLASGRFVLLGEKHDNPDHHRLQAWVLQAMIEAGRRPAVGFEMFSLDDAPALARHLAHHPKDAAGLGEAVNWSRRGWPAWALYQPIAEVALQAGLRLVATNLSTATAGALGRNSPQAVDAELIKQWQLDRALPPDVLAAMATDMREGHCGYATEERLGAMIRVQRARDAQMAASLVAAGQADGAVLIAGAGHVRRDYGVPVALSQQAPGATVISVAFLEVRQGHDDPLAYASRFHGATFPFDYVWFTPRVDDADPCAQFREQLQKLR